MLDRGTGVYVTGQVLDLDADEITASELASLSEPSARAGSFARGLALPATWTVSGAMVGAAVSTVLGWRGGLTVLAVAVAAGLSLLARGVAPLVATVMLWLAAMALFLETAVVLLPSREWNIGWLAPLFFVAVGATLVAGRLTRIRWPERSPVRAAAVDLVASVVALGWALGAARTLSTHAGAQAVRLLIGFEDNAAWLNTAATLGTPHGVTVGRSAALDTFGPLVTGYLALVRQGVGLGAADPLAPGLSAQTVAAAHALLIVAVPLVAAVLARRVMGPRRVSLTFLTWVTATAVTGAFCLGLASVGFLSASLATLLVLLAAWAAAQRPVWTGGWRSFLGWLVVSFLLYGAAASWVPLVPLGGIVLVAWAVALLVRTGRRRAVLPVLVAAGLCLVPALMGLALLRQYRKVVGPVGGDSALLAAPGVTPIITPAFLGVALALLALGWLALPVVRSGLPVRPLPLLRPALWLAAWVIPVGLIEGATTTGASHYGSAKLLYVMSGIWVTLLVTDLLASDKIGRRGLEAALALVVAVLVAGTVQTGPLYAAAQAKWPSGQPTPTWLAPAQAAVAGGGFVECLTTAPVVPWEAAYYTPYVCSRWSASMGGHDGAVALAWRFAMLDRRPAAAVALIRANWALDWKVVVIGATNRLCNAAAWWAPILAQPRVEFIAGPSAPPAPLLSTAPTPVLSQGRLLSCRSR